MIYSALLNAIAPVVPWYWTIGGGIALGLITIVATYFLQDKSIDNNVKTTLKLTEKVYATKMSAFCEKVSIMISDYRLEIQREIEQLRKELSEMRGDLTREMRAHRAVTKNLICADDTLRTLGTLYEGFIDAASDDTVKNVLHKGYQELNEFVDEIIRMGFDSISYKALKQKMMARGAMFKDDVDRITKAPEFTKNWEELHLKYVRELIKDIRPVFDNTHKNFEFNQKMILFLTEIQSFTHRSSVAILAAWKAYKNSTVT